MNWCDHMNWGWGGGLMMIVWIVLLVVLIFWIVRIAQRSGNQPLQSESAMDILKKRYARGEISKAEFEERKKDLL